VNRKAVKATKVTKSTETKKASRKRSRAPGTGSKKKVSSVKADSGNGAGTKRKKTGNRPTSRALQDWEGSAAAVGERPLGDLLGMCASVFGVAKVPVITNGTQSAQASTEEPRMAWSTLANDASNRSSKSWSAESMRQAWQIINQGRMPLPVKEATLDALWKTAESEGVPAAEGPVAQWFANVPAGGGGGGWKATQQQHAEFEMNAKAAAAAPAAAAVAAAVAAKATQDNEEARLLEVARNARFAALMAHAAKSAAGAHNHVVESSNNGGGKRMLSAVSGDSSAGGVDAAASQPKRARLEDAVRQSIQHQQQQHHHQYQAQHAFTGYPTSSVADVHGAAAASAIANSTNNMSTNSAASAAGLAEVDSVALAATTPGFALWAHVERQQYIEMALTRIRVMTEQRIAIDPTCLAQAQSDAESQARAVQLGLLSEYFSLPAAEQAEYGRQVAAMTAGVGDVSAPAPAVPQTTEATAPAVVSGIATQVTTPDEESSTSLAIQVNNADGVTVDNTTDVKTSDGKEKSADISTAAATETMDTAANATPAVTDATTDVTTHTASNAIDTAIPAIATGTTSASAAATATDTATSLQSRESSNGVTNSDEVMQVEQEQPSSTTSPPQALSQNAVGCLLEKIR
jgi:hypothetical protein